MNIMPRIASLLIGYFFGCILTAEIVVRIKTGKPVSEFGTGNPGMANVMRIFGFRAGALVLSGDLIKTITACTIAWILFGQSIFNPTITETRYIIGSIAILWAGLGAVLGHNWPFWKHFSGGKGVSVTCIAIFMFSPLLGLISDAAGMFVVLFTGYLPLGAVVITSLYAILSFLFLGTEAGIIALTLALIMVSRHYRGLIRIAQGREKRNAQYFKKVKKIKEDKET